MSVNMEKSLHKCTNYLKTSKKCFQDLLESRSVQVNTVVVVWGIGDGAKILLCMRSAQSIAVISCRTIILFIMS